MQKGVIAGASLKSDFKKNKTMHPGAPFTNMV